MNRAIAARLVALARLAMVLPFVMLALVPQGFMPGMTAAGQMVVVLCTPDGQVELTLDAAGEPTQRAKAPPCHWAGAAAGFVPVQAVSLPMAVSGPLETLAATVADLWQPAHDPRGIWARGPPSLI